MLILGNGFPEGISNFSVDEEITNFIFVVELSKQVKTPKFLT